MISPVLLTLNTIYYILWTIDLTRSIVIGKNFLPEYLSSGIPLVMFLIIAVIGFIENRIKKRAIFKKTYVISIIMFAISYIITFVIMIAVVEMMSKVIG